MHKKGMLKFPAINVNDSVTKSKFDNPTAAASRSSTRSSRANDVIIRRQCALFGGYGDVGKGKCAGVARAVGAVWVSGSRPALRLRPHGRLIAS